MNNGENVFFFLVNLLNLQHDQLLLQFIFPFATVFCLLVGFCLLSFVFIHYRRGLSVSKSKE